MKTSPTHVQSIKATNVSKILYITYVVNAVNLFCFRCEHDVYYYTLYYITMDDQNMPVGIKGN